MEILLLIVAVLFLLWRIKTANDEAFSDFDNTVTSPSENVSSKSQDSDSAQMDYDSPFRRFQSSSMLDLSNNSRNYYDDDCDISRAMWDPSCPLYHVFNDDSWNSSSSWDDSWSSSSWDSGSSSWDSWSSSSWDS